MRGRPLDQRQRPDGYYYINTKGKPALTVQSPYEAMLANFADGLAPVRILRSTSHGSGVWTWYEVGFLDKKGKVVVEPEFYDARPFSEGLAAVQAVGRLQTVITSGVTITDKYGQSVSSGLDPTAGGTVGCRARRTSGRPWPAEP